jgi:hypothetical protein
MKIVVFFMVMILSMPVYGGGISRSRARIVSHHNNDIVIQQKIVQFSQFENLQVIAVPVTDTGVQYYYQSEPLRGRNLSEQDKKEIVEEIVKGVLAGIEENFEVVGENGNKPTDNPTEKPQGGNIPPKIDPPADAGSELDKEILNLVTTNCAICHTEGSLNKEGIPTLLKLDGTLNVLADTEKEKLRRWNIWDSVYRGRMPKNGTILSESDADTFYKWIKEVK